MTDSLMDRARTGGRIKRAASALILAGICGFVLYTAVKAFAAAFANDDFPESLAVKVELLPLIFPVHMITGALALILVPAALALRRRRQWHRLVGRVAAVDVLVSGLTAFPVAWSPRSRSGRRRASRHRRRPG